MRPANTLLQIAVTTFLTSAIVLSGSRCFAQTPQPRSGSIVGVVWDSIRGGPLTGAQITLINTSVSAESNEDGRFFIPNLAPGRYVITFTHPRLDSLRYAHAPFEVTARADTVVQIQLAIPMAASPDLSRTQVEDVATLLKQMGVPVDSSLKSRIRAGKGDASDLLGLVVEQSSGRPIAGAMVSFDSTRFRAISDREGRFAFRDIPTKTYALTVTMLGFGERKEQLEIPPGKLLDLRVDLTPKAIALAPLVVEVRSLGLDRSGFYTRRNDRGTFGKFFTSADIERRNAFDVTDLFYSIPGVRVLPAGMGKHVVRFNRSQDGYGGGCVPPVYIDGARVPNAFDFLSPQWIDGIEVYVGSQAPIEYLGRDACGAILVWTKRGR